MLTSYLRGGDTLDFTIRNDTRQMPIIQMLMTADAGARTIGLISLTPTEAITVSEHLNELVTYIADHCAGYTNAIQEEANEASETRELGSEAHTRGEERPTSGCMYPEREEWHNSDLIQMEL
jgi:hypothetical protein